MESYLPQTLNMGGNTICRFREFQPRDFERICELDRICFAEGIAYAPDEIAWFLAQRGAFCFVAEALPDAKRPATAPTTDGFHGIVAWILASLGRRGSGHIITIDVHPGWQRRKIGESLMDVAEQRMKDQGCSRIHLEAAVVNSGALAFYERRGYKKLRELTNYYSDGTNAYRMEKLL